MSELNFFRHYINGKTASGKNILYKKYAEQYTHLINSIPELPFFQYLGCKKACALYTGRFRYALWNLQQLAVMEQLPCSDIRSNL